MTPRGPEASAAGRLQRLLALVPWVMDHPAATVDEVCARFSMTRAALMADLELLFVSGVPPYGPGDLIEAWVDGDRVHIGLAEFFARAPRLTWREAAGLYLAGRALAALPEVDERGALTRALAKLETVLPADQLAQVQDLDRKVSVDLDGDDLETARRTALVRAAAAGRRVVLEYYSGSRDALTRRKVDPWLVWAASGHWYLTGWCHLVSGERLFRVDRVVAVQPTDEPFERPADFDPSAYGDPARAAFDEGLVCELDLAGPAEWAAEYFPILGSERAPDGRLRMRLAARELSWVVRLVLRLAPHAEPVSPPELRRPAGRLTGRSPRPGPQARLDRRRYPRQDAKPRPHAPDHDPRHLPDVRRGRADPARRRPQGLHHRGAQLLRVRLPDLPRDGHQAGRRAGGPAAHLGRRRGRVLGAARRAARAPLRASPHLGRPARPAPRARVPGLVGPARRGVPLTRPGR